GCAALLFLFQPGSSRQWRQFVPPLGLLTPSLCFTRCSERIDFFLILLTSRLKRPRMLWTVRGLNVILALHRCHSNCACEDDSKERLLESLLRRAVLASGAIEGSGLNLARHQSLEPNSFLRSRGTLSCNCPLKKVPHRSSVVV